MPDEPALLVSGDSLFIIWPGETTFEFAKFHESRDTLTAEVSVVYPALGLLHWARVNLASTVSRNGVAKALNDELPTLPWRHMLERSCRMVAQHVRMGEAAAPLIAAEPMANRWLIEPVVPAGEITVLFGDGGAGKSLLALAVCVAGILGQPLGTWPVADVHRVLYLDWESDRRTHAERLWGLTVARELIPDTAILHRRLWRPLTEDLAQIRKDRDQHQADLVICDSLGAACGPEPEGADAAVRTLMALRGLEATKLVIAHVSKASAEQSRSRPFGSVYVQNLARSVIEARRLETAEEEHEMTVSLYHRKSNAGRLAKSTALTFSWEIDGQIAIHKADPDLQSATVGQQIAETLLSGNKTVALLAKELDVGQATIRKQLHRMLKRGIVVEIASPEVGRGKESLWGLAALKGRQED